MSTIRDSMGNKWWADMYNRYNLSDPADAYYGRFPSSGLNLPVTIDAGPQFAVQLTRHCNGVCAYDVGSVGEYGRQNRLGPKMNACSDVTGAPFICARGFLGDRTNPTGASRYASLASRR